MIHHLWSLIFAFLLLGLVGCNILPTPVPPTPTVALPTPASTPEPLPNVTPPPAGVSNPQTQRLIVWLIPEMSPFETTASSQLLAQQLALFNENHPDFELQIELKSATGQGGMLSYLSTGRGVAPTILPDVVLLPAAQVREAATAGYIYPLQTLLTAEMVNDLFPVARELVEVDDNLYGYPHVLNGLTHSAFTTSVFTTTIPTQWNNLKEANGVFVFPAAGSNGPEFLLQIYLAIGGTLTTADGQPALDTQRLTTTLEQINYGRLNGFVLPQSHTLATMEDVWQVYQNSQANILLTTSEYYLGRGETNLGVAPLPGPNGPLPPFVTGWAWAVSTSDPARQALAIELIDWLANAPNMGDWTQQAHKLPARRSAFERWEPNSYTSFLRTELLRAESYPMAAVGAINNAIGEALLVITSPAGGSPAGLAEQAAGEVRP